MRSEAAIALFTLLIGGGCSADVYISLGLEGRSAILVTRSGEDVTLDAVEGAAAMHSQPVGAVDVYVLDYDVSLGELGLVEGPLERVTSSEEPGLGLPPGGRLRHVSVQETSASSPQVVQDWPAWFDGLKLPLPDVPACVDGGGCLGPRPGDAMLVCKPDCEEASAPAAPAPPEPPALTPCPAGWVERAPRAAGEVVECLPWAAPEACEEGSAQRPGEGCLRVGRVCPVGRFASDPVAGVARYYVDSSASAGGDGTEAQPFRALADVPLVSTGTTVLFVAAGDYSTPAVWAGPALVVGACAQQTRLGAATIEGGQVKLTGVGLSRLEVDGADVTLDGVWIDADSGRGLLVTSGRLRAADVLVRGQGFTALEVASDGQATLARARLEGGGVSARGRAELTDSVIVSADTGARAYLSGGVELNRVHVEDVRAACLEASSAGGIRVAQVRCQTSDPARSAHVRMVDRGALEGSKLVVRGGTGFGLRVSGGQVSVADLVVRDTGPDPVLQRYGAGLEALGGGVLRVERGLVLRNQGFGVLTKDAETFASLVDVRVADVVGWAIDGERGTGLQIEDTGTLDVSRVLVERAHGMGIFVDSRGQLEGEDLTVQDVLPRDSNGAFGRGIEVDNSGLVTLTRVAVRRALNIAVHVLHGDSIATFEDLEVTETGRSGCYSYSCNEGIADGLTSVLGGALHATRFRVADNEHLGVRVINESVLELEDGVISGHAIGAQVITEGYDLSLLSNRVQYVDNAQNIELLGVE